MAVVINLPSHKRKPFVTPVEPHMFVGTRVVRTPWWHFWDKVVERHEVSVTETTAKGITQYSARSDSAEEFAHLLDVLRASAEMRQMHYRFSNNSGKR